MEQKAQHVEYFNLAAHTSSILAAFISLSCHACVRIQTRQVLSPE